MEHLVDPDEGDVREQHEHAGERECRTRETAGDDQQLRAEDPERRHAGDRERAQEDHHAGERRNLDHAPHAVRVACLVSAEYPAGAEERERLAGGVHEDVEERAVRRDRAADPEAERHDPHVLDRRVREQPLVVGLTEREERGQHQRHRAEHEQQHVDIGRTDRELRDRTQPQNGIQRGGEQRPGQHRADRARTLRMGVRQPRVHRHQPHLGAEPDEREPEPGTHERRVQVRAACASVVYVGV